MKKLMICPPRWRKTCLSVTASSSSGHIGRPRGYGQERRRVMRGLMSSTLS
jgi:hypothetical protein